MQPHLDILGLHLSAYGAWISVGIITTYFLTTYLGKRIPLGENHSTTVLVAAIFGAFGGAKLLAGVVEGRWDLRAGGVYLGGVIGVVLATLLVASIGKFSRIQALDLVAPVGALGHFFGRMGCLFAGCCYGRPTDAAIGMHFKAESVAYQTLRVVDPSLIDGDHTVPLIPTQLVEALFELGLAGVLSAVLLRKPPSGTVFALYAITYAAFRFVIEYFRFDPERGYVVEGVLSTSQFISLFLFGFGAWALWRYRLRRSSSS